MAFKAANKMFTRQKPENPIQNAERQWNAVNDALRTRETVTVLKPLVEALTNKILAEENRLNVHAGPILGPYEEVFARQRSLDALVEAALKYPPPGVCKLVLSTASLIFSHLSVPILAHVSFYKPVLKLIESCNDEHMAYLDLINVVLMRLKETPDIVSLFMLENHGISKPKKSEFIVFQRLLSLYKDPTMVDMLPIIRRTVLSCFQINHEGITQYILGTPFIDARINELCESFKFLPEKSKRLPTNFSEFLPLLRFANRLAKVPNEKFRLAFLDAFEKQFIQAVLVPKLTNPRSANNTTIYLREILGYVDAGLRNLFTQIILEPRMINIILKRINYTTKSNSEAIPAETLATNTLRLISTLLRQYEYSVFNDIILKYLIPADLDIYATDTVTKVAQFEKLIKEQDVTPTTLIYKQYVNNRILRIHTALSKWPSDAFDKNTKKENGGHSNKNGDYLKSKDIDPGPLYRVLMQALENIMGHSQDFALFLTECINALAQMPHVLLHSFLLDTSTKFSLFKRINKILDSIKDSYDTEEHLELANTDNDIDTVHLQPDAKTRQACLVLIIREFTKELTVDLCEVAEKLS